MGFWTPRIGTPILAIALRLSVMLGVSAGLAPSRLLAADLALTMSGAPSVVYDPARAACDPNDFPDMNPRVFRDALGVVKMITLHSTTRILRGPDLDHVTIDCHVALESPHDPDPAHYADTFFVAATWTTDGTAVSALVHHEYHAETHKTCRVDDTLACWYNTILAFRSTDAGGHFAKASPLVVAAAPFPQDVGQGRHRGFFEPSNMFGDGRYTYVFAATTGWAGQNAGSCLFRTPDPANPALWRAYDGTDFTVRYADPYRGPTRPKPCKVIDPFLFAVGTVVHHRASQTWLAVLQAGETGPFKAHGFFYATSKDLVHWGPPRLLIEAQTLGVDLCKAGSSLINYPSVLDPASPSRNFDEIGDHPFLYFTVMQIAHCQTGARMLVRQPIDLRVIE